MSKLRVLVACEYSARVRDAFLAEGCDAWSCDLLSCEGDPSRHIQGDVLPLLTPGRWDLMVAHPTCRYLCNSGAKHLYIGTRKENGPDPQRWQAMREGAEFFLRLWNAPVPFIAVENPIMLGYAQKIIGAKPSQTIQPFEYGDPYQKATCLWLKNLPRLTPTKIMTERRQECHLASPGPDRWKDRSRTYPGIAAAMAAQWTHFLTTNPTLL